MLPSTFYQTSHAILSFQKIGYKITDVNGLKYFIVHLVLSIRTGQTSSILKVFFSLCLSCHFGIFASRGSNE